jgi:glucokinase
MLLAGDIGGTKTNLVIISADDDPRSPVAEATFPSQEYDSLEEVVRDFLADHEMEIEWGVFGVAGPVVNGRAQITNLPWNIDEDHLEQALDIPSVHLMNDLESIANAVPVLEQDDLHTLNAGKPAEQGPIAVIAPGTGLGEAFLTWDGSRYEAHPSEGGHTDFGPLDRLQMGLLRYMLERFDRVSYERVCSGIGLPNIYDYLRDSNYAEEPTWLAEKLAAAGDRTPVIVNAALDEENPCSLCAATLDTFASILAAEAGNLALKVLATGGVYLGGGIPPRILSVLEQKWFLETFQRKGRFTDLMERIPLHVILHRQAALLGVIRYGLEHMGET